MTKRYIVHPLLCGDLVSVDESESFREGAESALG